VSTKDATQATRPFARLVRVPNPRRARREDWAQLVRFCVVGASGYVINLAVFTALVGGANAHYVLAAIVAFCVAWCSNFVFNKWWTFRRHELRPAHQAARYLLVSVLALGLNIAVLHVLVVAGAGEVTSQAFAIAAVTPFSFLLNRRWSFR
jgi:putative flippase GtrA